MNSEQVHRHNQEKRVKAFEVLSNISRNMAVAADQDEFDFYEFIYGQLGLLGIENFFLATYDERTDTIEIVFAVKKGKKADASKDDAWRSWIGDNETIKKIIQSRTNLLLNSQKEVAGHGFSPVPGWQDSEATTANAWFGIPMLIRKKVIGIAVQYLYGDGNVFDEDDKMISQAIADMATIAMDKKQVKEERNQLRYLIDNIPGCYIYIKDLESRFAVANEAVAQIMGQASPKDVIGKSDFDFYPKKEAQGYYDIEQNIIQTKKSVKNKEEPSQDQDGNTRVTLTTKAPLRNTKGEIIGTFGIGRDVTERILAERELEKERNLLRTLIDSVPDHIYAKDTEHHFTLANKTVIDYTPEVNSEPEILGKTDRDFKRKFYKKYEADERKIFQKGEPLLNHEEKIEDPKTGKDVWLLTTKVPLYSGKEIIGLVGINRDITEVKQFQNRLESLIKLSEKITLLKEGRFDIQEGEKEIAKFIRKNASGVMDTDNMYIALYDGKYIRFPLDFIDGGEEKDVLRRKFDEEKKGEREGKTEFIIRNKDKLLIRTKQEDKQWYDNHPDYRDFTGKGYLSSWIGVPIKLRDNVLGVIATYSEDKENIYTEEDVNVLQSLGSLVAVALENLKLYSGKEQQANEVKKAKSKISKYHEITTQSRLATDFMPRLSNLAGTIPIWASLIEEDIDILVQKIKQHTKNIKDDTEELIQWFGKFSYTG